MKREVALDRLRAGGRLQPASRPRHLITAKQAASPVAKAVRQIVEANQRDATARCLAPSANHAVLP